MHFSYVNDLNKAFDVIIFMEYVTSCITISQALYQLSNSIDDIKYFLASLIVLAYILMELFFYCYIASKLIYKVFFIQI